MLAGRSIISDADRDEPLRGLDAVEPELTLERFPFDSEDEDIHMAIERRLTEIVGAVAGRLHTARSRNDQVVTDLMLYTRERCAHARAALASLMAALLARAEEHADWPMPGYTHLQRAQPVYLGHHLLAYFWMLDRDRGRFAFAEGQPARCRWAPGRSPASTSRPIGRWSPRSSAFPPSRPTRSTPSPGATSCSTI